MTELTIQPLLTTIVVSASKERAFKVFTEGLDLWWPRKHSIGGSPQKQAVLECREGGRWYEIGEDGSTCDWGKVLAWSPPNRLLLGWQIDAAWKYDPDFLTEVELTFSEDGESRTIVQLEHRNLERFGAIAEQQREAYASEGGWSTLLRLFAEKAAATTN